MQKMQQLFFDQSLIQINTRDTVQWNALKISATKIGACTHLYNRFQDTCIGILSAIYQITQIFGKKKKNARMQLFSFSGDSTDQSFPCSFQSTQNNSASLPTEIFIFYFKATFSKLKGNFKQGPSLLLPDLIYTHFCQQRISTWAKK